MPAQRSTSVPLVLSRSITASRQLTSVTSSIRSSRCSRLTRWMTSRFATRFAGTAPPGPGLGDTALGGSAIAARGSPDGGLADKSIPLIVPRPTMSGMSASSGNRMISACDARSATTTSNSCARGPSGSSDSPHVGHTASPAAETIGQASS